MDCVANYEVRSECSVIEDDLVLRIKHPHGRYRARIQNIRRSTYTTPFLLSVHLYFEAPSLDEAREVAEEALADFLNMLAFTTGARVRRHRIRQIADATPGISGMRSVRMWGDAVEYDDPQPFLDEESATSIERLLSFELPPAVRRAMRWYRLGVNASVPDDQFMNFWFAVEILAEFMKSPEKVPDRCPQCRSPLFCELCNTHPAHKPYAKQAIRSLLKTVDAECDDELIDRFDKTRNSLMHGSTLHEIENSLPQPHEQIVDVLGRVLWKALVHQYPRELFDGRLAMGFPSTYIDRHVDGVAHLETIVPVDRSGELDLRFPGVTMAMVPNGPPQSARATVISITTSQLERLSALRFTNGEHQDLCQRVFNSGVRTGTHQIRAVVLSTDMVAINKALVAGEKGEWQDLFREILARSA